MKKKITFLCLTLLFFILFEASPPYSFSFQGPKMINLPEPVTDGRISVEAALQARKSIRNYDDAPLMIHEVSQLLWAAQGITRKNRMRTAPSAGALYPLEVYLVAGNVLGLEPGIYHYLPQYHKLQLVSSGDRRAKLANAALGQDSIANGGINLVLAGVYERTSVKYASRAKRYVHIESGHAAQNIYLQAVGLGLGTVSIGAFDDEKVKRILMLRKNEFPICIMPVGNIR